MPEIDPPAKMSQAMTDGSAHRFWCDERPGAPPLLSAFRPSPGDSTALLIGPEGGWTDPEREQFAAAGVARRVAGSAGIACRNSSLRSPRGHCAGLALSCVATIEFSLMNMNYGGSVEYIVAALLAFQILIALVFLKRRYAMWPRAAWAGVVVLLLVLWSATLGALYLAVSGVMYTGRTVPAGLGAAIAAIGYFWILVSSLTVAMGALVRVLFARIPGAHSSNRRQWLRAAGVVAIGAPAAAAAFGVFVERHDYRVNELDLPVPGLHPDLDGFRIVQVSDLHVSPFLSTRQAGRVIDMANELKADLAVFTGDLITALGDPLDEAIRQMVRLRSDLGVYACKGKHEEYMRCTD